VIEVPRLKEACRAMLVAGFRPWISDGFDENGANMETSGSKRKPVTHIRANASTLEGISQIVAGKALHSRKHNK